MHVVFLNCIDLLKKEELEMRCLKEFYSIDNQIVF